MPGKAGRGGKGGGRSGKGRSTSPTKKGASKSSTASNVAPKLEETDLLPANIADAAVVAAAVIGGADAVDPSKTTIGKQMGAIDKVTYPTRSLPLLRPPATYPGRTTVTSSSVGLAGYVRATPPGHLLNAPHLLPASGKNDGYKNNDKTNNYNHEQQSQSKAVVDEWNKFRSEPIRQYTYPREGFDHILGNEDIRQVDGIPIGGRKEKLDGKIPRSRPAAGNSNNNNNKGDGNNNRIDNEYLEPEEEEALRAELAQRRILLAQSTMDDIEEGDATKTDGREYGASITPLDAPIGSLREKWRVLPHFLKLRGLMKQHIDSFDHFVNVEMRQIVQVSLR